MGMPICRLYFGGRPSLLTVVHAAAIAAVDEETLAAENPRCSKCSWIRYRPTSSSVGIARRGDGQVTERGCASLGHALGARARARVAPLRVVLQFLRSSRFRWVDIPPSRQCCLKLHVYKELASIALNCYTVISPSGADSGSPHHSGATYSFKFPGLQTWVYFSSKLQGRVGVTRRPRRALVPGGACDSH